METQTRFDLNAAIADWQQELAAQPDFTPVVRRELETHLRDTITELQKRGLNNEESFWLARRRTGRPQQVAEEFAKADPGRVWRDRAFWITAFLLVENFWNTFWNQLFVYNFQTMRQQLQDVQPGWIWFYLPYWLGEIQLVTCFQILTIFLRFIPIVLLAFVIVKGQPPVVKTVSSFITSTRTRFVLVALVLFFVANSVHFMIKNPILWTVGWIVMSQFLWTGSLIALAAWLIPSKKETAVKAT